MSRIGLCADCYRPMAFAHPNRTPEGFVSHCAHGLCNSCYSRLHQRAAVRGCTPRGRPTDTEVDEVAIERALAGMPVELNPAERSAVIAEWTRRGLSAAEIARRTGLAQRSVTRIRAQLRKAA